MGFSEAHLLLMAIIALSVILVLFSLIKLSRCIVLNREGAVLSKDGFFKCMSYFRFRENKFIYFSGFLLLLSLMIMMVSNYYARSEFKSILKTGPQLEIVVDGESLKGKEKIMFIKDSLNIYTRKGRSGSHPVRLRKVSLIFEGERHRYYFQRDSRDNNMYWVYLPSELIKINIGFVKTLVLD